jgi:hypothetical protein
MDDKSILGRIHDLVEEEKQLRTAGRGVAGDDRQRLQVVENELDQCWDLLRQRRALREASDDPDKAKVRPEDEVEDYLQ